jgi:hypothetical protein
MSNYRIRWYGHILRMNEGKIPRKGSEHESKRKMPKWETDQYGNKRSRTMSHRNKEVHGNKVKIRMSCGKKAIDGVVWFSDESHEVEIS